MLAASAVSLTAAVETVHDKVKRSTGGYDPAHTAIPELLVKCTWLEVTGQSWALKELISKNDLPFISWCIK